MLPSSVNRGVLPAAAAAVFAAFAGMFGGFPILTPYVQALGGTAAAAALAVSIYSATNLPGNLVAGFLIGRWGPLAVLRSGLVLVTLAVILHTATDSVSALIAYRGVHGFVAGWVVPAAFALAADELPEDRRGRGMGRLGAPIGLSAVLLPPLTGIIGSRAGPQAAFVALAAVLAVLTLFVEVFYRRGLRRGRVGAPDAPPSTAAGAGGDAAGAHTAGSGAAGAAGAAGPADAAGAAGPAGDLRRLITDPRMLPVWLGGFVLPFNLGVLAWYLPIAAEQLQFGASAAGGAGLGVLAVVAAAVMAGPGGRLTDRAPLRSRLALLGAALLGVGMALWTAPGAGAFYGAAAVFGVGFGLVFPAVNALLAELTTPAIRGLAFGLFYAWYSVATAVGPPLLARWHEMSGQAPFGAGAAVALVLALVGAVAGRVRGGLR